ncbi:glycosyltransferase family 2 protein [Flavobacterium johnsoniae]|uniref:Glycosyltransferase involved in cell wall bisynthesis n=1 Tax=Flavobacterium johnsoniae TaxID=986 RepID=A0A1M5L4J1_FLAJO|nr:glycosyltransferase family 2 protein [Flavobacterium johnsoniae]SHG59906.1 Glycosyltransferase involved in cell wall bisynthesis [Flavobacterium johnsoniae]
MSSKLLSICIPTYNRCDILDETLRKLFENPDFNNEYIEVIVSDNCSTDDTKKVVSKYSSVKYYCNEKNTSFYNLTTALSYATGKYIKLYNDTFNFRFGALEKIISKIRMHENEKTNLFFYPNFLHNHNTTKTIDSIESFFFHCSYNTTSTAAIGFWKKDFDVIGDKNKYAPLHFPQLEWMYRIVENGRQTIIYFEDWFEVTVPNKKGGYNVFKTFVNDYLNIIKMEKLSFFAYELEKYRLCRHFIYLWLVVLFVSNKDKYNFETKNVYKILFTKYWYEPYFYPMLILFLLKKISKKNNSF